MGKAEIGSFEAKTKFAELLRRVQKGERIIITLHGKPVAEIGPHEQDTAGQDAAKQDAAERQQRLDAAVEGLRNFRPANSALKLDQAEIRKMRDEGRA